MYTLRDAGVPVTPKEFVGLLDALDARVIKPNAEQFYHLSRLCLVKDERYFDAFDKAFAHFFEGAEKFTAIKAQIPKEWTRDAGLEKLFSKEEIQKIKDLGGWDALMKAFEERLKEQRKRHQGGSKWIGTGGTSPFGSGGYNPAGIRVGDAGKRQGRATKVWEQRHYAPLAGNTTLNTRNIKMSLRRLRTFTREGRASELDVDATIRETSRRGAMLDVVMRPARRNNVKVLLFFDAGGSMTPHIRHCEQLFSSARTEMKRLETFYFHNCVYGRVWQDEHRWEKRLRTWDILHKYNADHRVIIVGDAAMSPYELLQVGGAVDHFNDETGVAWLKRLREKFPYLVWLNPEPVNDWPLVDSTRIIQSVLPGCMLPLTLEGLGQAIHALKRQSAPTLA